MLVTGQACRPFPGTEGSSPDILLSGAWTLHADESWWSLGHRTRCWCSPTEVIKRNWKLMWLKDFWSQDCYEVTQVWERSLEYSPEAPRKVLMNWSGCVFCVMHSPILVFLYLWKMMSFMGCLWSTFGFVSNL